VVTETGGTEDEDDGVHDGLETHDGDQADDTANTVKRSDTDDHDEGTGGTEGEEDGGGNDGEEGSSDESADGESDETVREELRSSRVGDTGNLVGVEEEERSDSDLSTDIEELSDESGNGSDLLPEWLVESRVDTLSVGKSLGLGLESLFGNLGELGEEEGEGDDDTETGDGHVDELDSGKILGVCATEEELGGDQRTSKGCNTVETLRKLQSQTSNVVRWHDSDIRVGGDFKSGETASNHSGADNETGKDGARVGCTDREVCDRPEEDSTERVETETGNDGDLVSLSLQDFGSDGRVCKVTNTKVGGLKTGRLSSRDLENVLEVLVQDIEKTVGETPKEEERGNEDESPEVLSPDDTSLEDRSACAGSVGSHSTASHCDDGWKRLGGKEKKGVGECKVGVVGWVGWAKKRLGV